MAGLSLIYGSMQDIFLQDIFSGYHKWLRHGLVACGIGSILVLGGCELGEPPIEQKKEPKVSLVDQYKQANKDSRDPGLAANPNALKSSSMTAAEAIKEGAEENQGGEDQDKAE